LDGAHIFAQQKSGEKLSHGKRSKRGGARLNEAPRALLSLGAGVAGMSALDQAKKLFRSFHGRAPKAGEIISIEAPAKAMLGLEVGTMLSLGYRRLDGESFYHEFEGPKPKVFVTPGGTQILIVGGGYRFTDRGFVK
jgi:hypothetical protein